MKKAVQLAESVKTNLHEILFQNLKLTFIYECSKSKPSQDFKEIEEYSYNRWNLIIKHLLNIQQQESDRNLVFTFQDLLTQADYITAKTGELTAKGFSFILLDTPSQVHQILLEYLKRIKRASQSSN